MRRARRRPGTAGPAGDPAAPSRRPSTAPQPTARRWWEARFVRLGGRAWALLGIVGVGALLYVVLSELSIVAVPLILALFPAALLSPASDWLTRRRVPPALASLLTILAFLLVVLGGAGLLAPQIAAEAPGIVEEVESGIDQLEELLDEGLPFIEEGTDVAELLALAQEQAVSFLQREGVAIASTLAEGIAGLLFGLVGLFFYLKDGRRIAGWALRLFPREARDTAGEIGTATWTTLGGYFRGQLLVALVDAIFIGLGLYLLGVPLALPLAVLVFFGGLFPIVGAFVSGAVAVLVALATQGVAIALGALAVVLAVQQLESNVLAPVVLGKATQLHPLAVIVSLTAGGVLLGILGAFLAVPIAASLARGARILRQRFDATDGRGQPEPAFGPPAPAS